MEFQVELITVLITQIDQNGKIRINTEASLLLYGPLVPFAIEAMAH